MAAMATTLMMVFRGAGESLCRLGWGVELLDMGWVCWWRWLLECAIPCAPYVISYYGACYEELRGCLHLSRKGTDGGECHRAGSE